MFNIYKDPSNNIITATDAYKFSHQEQRPPYINNIQYYVAPRMPHDVEMISAGVYPLLKQLEGIVIDYNKINHAEFIAKCMGIPFNRKPFEDIITRFGGKLPLSIRAVRDGTKIAGDEVQLTVESTDPDYEWLAGRLETIILRGIWYPSTVATTAYEIKKTIMEYWDDPNVPIDLVMNDFGARGVSSKETAEIGGGAFLIAFMGTDNVESVEYIMSVYPETDPTKIGGSIAASEHSVMTILGEDGEIELMRNMIRLYKNSGIFSCVSDSYDYKRAVSRYWLGKLLPEVLKADCRVVIRPDSGDPVEMVLFTLDQIAEKVGFTYGPTGLKIVDTHFRVIQGDGINKDTIRDILKAVCAAGFSPQNVVFGMGGGLLQDLNRDTYKYAMKACAMDRGNGWEDVQKKTPGKVSKAGYQGADLEEVFRDGEILISESFMETRNRFNKNFF